MRCYADSKLGSGGFSKVYRGVDMNAQRPVAIKIYHEAFSDESVRQVLTNSVRMHGLLNHSSRFPKLLAHGDRSLVMEFIDGVNLGCLELQQTETEALAIGYQLAVCLSEFHGSRPENPPVHRDVKPKNTLVRYGGDEEDYGKVVLCDFDLSVIDEESVDGSERIIGTPQFLSPEQASCQPVLPTSDLFSLGSSLYLLFTGRSLNDGCYKALHIDEFAPSFDLDRGDVREVIETCWRIGRTYESTEHMTVELADRLKRIGIDPERSHEVLASLVKNQVRATA